MNIRCSIRDITLGNVRIYLSPHRCGKGVIALAGYKSAMVEKWKITAR